MGSDASRRVLLVSQHYPPDKSGNASRVSDTAKHLTAEGWRVDIAAPPPAFPHGQFERSWKRHETETIDGVTVHRLWSWVPTDENPSFLVRIAYYLLFPLHVALWMIVARKKYDALITSFPPIFTGIVGLVESLRPSTSTPWVVDVRDLWIDASIGLGFIEEGSLIEVASRKYQQIVLSRADAIGVTTNELGNRLVDHYDIDSRKLLHLPNGVDTERFKTTNLDSDPVIIYTGNVGYAQDLESCIRALSHLQDESIRLKIVGDGDVRSELERLTADLDLDGQVEFTGLVPRERIPELLGQAMIGIAPLKDEETLEYAVPTKVYEYLSSGLPVVVTGTGEVETLVEQSEAGLVVENDPEEIARVFERLINDSELREQMKDSGRAHVADNYDRKVIASRLSRKLNSLVG